MNFSKNIKNWLVIGISKNWETALSQPIPIWGLKQRFRSEFEILKTGDILWFYVTSPVSGVVGLGIVKDKYIDNSSLTWREELEKGRIIWPLRFRIQVLKVLPQSLWKTHKIKIDDFGLFWQLGFHLLDNNYVIELFKRAKSIFEIDENDIFAGASIAKSLIAEKEPCYKPPLEKDKLILTHNDLQTQIAELGKLQFYYTEVEYPLSLTGEKKNLDVVWKREIDGVPSFAFEIEISGMIERALDRLNFAFKKWNSRPRLVIPEGFLNKVNNILKLSERDFSNSMKTYSSAQIMELWNKKRELRGIEQKLEIY